MNEPKGQLVTQTIAMPADTNTNGDIFAGWILSEMDLGAGIMARQICKSRAVTVSINALEFRLPVKVGDTISCFAELVSMGRSSMKIKIEVWRMNHLTKAHDKVTEGEFTFVAINEHHIPYPADPASRLKELKS